MSKGEGKGGWVNILFGIAILMTPFTGVKYPCSKGSYYIIEYI